MAITVEEVSATQIYPIYERQRNMVNLRGNCEVLLLAHEMGDLNDEEFVLLYDLNRSTNLDLPYWDYERFDLDRMSDDKRIAEF